MDDNQSAVVWIAALSELVFIGTLIAIPVIVWRMPADYFVRRNPAPEIWGARHSVVRSILLVLKNLVGVLLVIAGIVLSLPLVPGQGILTILIARWQSRRRAPEAAPKPPPKNVTPQEDGTPRES